MIMKAADSRADRRADRAAPKHIVGNSVLERTERTTFYRNFSKFITYWKYSGILDHVRGTPVLGHSVRLHLAYPHELSAQSSALSADALSGAPK